MKKKLLLCTMIFAMAFANGACNKNTEPAEEAVETQVALSDLSEYQISVFIVGAEFYVDQFKSGEVSYDELTETQELAITDYITFGELPENAVELFREWKESVDYKNKLMDWVGEVGNEDKKIAVNENVNDKHKSQVQQPVNKPKPSESQVKDQVNEAQSKPITPSPNTPKE